MYNFVVHIGMYSVTAQLESSLNNYSVAAGKKKELHKGRY